MKFRSHEGPGGLPLLISFCFTALMGGGVSAQEAKTPAEPPIQAPAAVPEPLARDAKLAGQEVPVPSRKKYVAPEYPAQAALEGIRGIVILEVLIGEDGKVSNARITRSIPGLDDAALTAVRLWEYEPTRVANQPVKVLLSQSITFALRLPELERAPGVPELKSGGAPPVPPSLATAESASVSVTLGAQGEVTEAAVLSGNSVLSGALLRAVRSWRFVLPEGGTPPTFTVEASWNPATRPNLTLKATHPRTEPSEAGTPAAEPGPEPEAAAVAGAAEPSRPGALAQSPAAPDAGAPISAPAQATGQAPAPAAPAPVEAATEVLPARPEPASKEEGVSAVTDVSLGENIPDLVKGRRPVWPPLARLGNVTGDVVVRFSVDLAGRVTVHSTEGVELLREAAEQGVGTWLFRRTAIDRLNLIATFTFGGDRTMAKVVRVE